MYEFVRFVGNCWSTIIQLLGNYSFNIGGRSYNLFVILLGFILLGMIISVFWKGAKG